jgi:hypothetical protein
MCGCMCGCVSINESRRIFRVNLARSSSSIVANVVSTFSFSDSNSQMECLDSAVVSAEDSCFFLLRFPFKSTKKMMWILYHSFLWGVRIEREKEHTRSHWIDRLTFSRTGGSASLCCLRSVVSSSEINHSNRNIYAFKPFLEAKKERNREWVSEWVSEWGKERRKSQSFTNKSDEKVKEKVLTRRYLCRATLFV